MASDMVERVAQAMAAAVSGPEGSELFRIHWEEFGPGYIDGAIAALKALRDPTPEMVEAMKQHIGPLKIMWQAAVDAAIGEG